ncbi:MAG: CCA tRNA nucleotidyltransferase [Lentisphaeria bacterium]|nr:MAG: CCA tRNA nucleotidyltransferase [Lentisphaeria bacterium]
MERFRRRFSISDPAFRAACDAVRRLKAAGFEAGLVGGSVRDLLLGHVPADFDLVTTAVPEQLAKLFPGSRSVGASFGVSLIDAGEFRFEAATAREERNYLDGRHPELVRYTDSLEYDMKRRDFTVNALWYDPVSEEVCDCVGGVTDLERGILRTVGAPEERFREDYLRMLRAVRFAARLGLEPAPGTRRAISDLAPLAAELAPERIAGSSPGC